MNEHDLTQIAIGIIVGVGALLYLVIRIGLHDRRERERKDKDPPKT